ncbi:MAG: cytochrome C [Acidobacteria bacterium RIFCSPLOWO2_02_FULL_67_36]|nr:MAG: cytochrome C [Acidobacteria bacterium RIFCSPLOWO2_02_FULL_67_36]OFW24423.1 MAG: cytochrome C [Acidobacteria bacterium RIFCSPLOWO2_12_FULL_66_21]
MKDSVVRFTPIQRIEHSTVMSLFAVLALTGLPQKFYDHGWAQRLMGLLGGVDTARFVHRTAGVLFSLVVVVHISRLVVLVAQGRTSLALVPTRQDFRDAIVTLRYYLGLSDHQARFDKFDYRQKFEYWGLVLGAAIVVGTGFILLYPATLTRFLPGEFVPASQLAHSNEGLMAFLVVIVWHIYNAHLNPDVFPFDTSIFTGRISRHRLRHEHPLEFERLERNERNKSSKIA